VGRFLEEGEGIKRCRKGGEGKSSENSEVPIMWRGRKKAKRIQKKAKKDPVSAPKNKTKKEQLKMRGAKRSREKGRSDRKKLSGQGM